LACSILVALASVGRTVEVLLGHEVGVDVVVGDGAVFVRTSDPIDTKTTFEVEVPERTPQPRGFDEDLEPDLALEDQIDGGANMMEARDRDVRVHMESRGPGRPVAGALLAVDRAPWVGCPREAEVARTLLCSAQCRMPPTQDIGGGRGRGVGEDRH